MENNEKPDYSSYPIITDPETVSDRWGGIGSGIIAAEAAALWEAAAEREYDLNGESPANTLAVNAAKRYGRACYGPGHYRFFAGPISVEVCRYTRSVSVRICGRGFEAGLKSRPSFTLCGKNSERVYSL